MGGWALPKEKNIYRCTINIPTHPTHPFSVSLENALVTSGREFYGKTGAPDGAAHIYSVEYIKQCESHAFCHIPVLNQLPLGTLASLNSYKTKKDFTGFYTDVNPCNTMKDQILLTGENVQSVNASI